MASLAFQLSGLVSVPLGLGFWMLEPFFSVLYAAAVGMAASTVGHSCGSSIVLSVAVHFGLGLALYRPAQQLMSPGLVVFAPNPRRWRWGCCRS
jgi:O-antigen/teichoic acid export membrane protein